MRYFYIFVLLNTDNSKKYKIIFKSNLNITNKNKINDIANKNSKKRKPIFI